MPDANEIVHRRTLRVVRLALDGLIARGMVPSTLEVALEKQPECGHERRVECHQQRRAGNVCCGRSFARRPQPPAEADAGPGHEIVQQDHAHDIADEQRDRKGSPAFP